MNSTRLSLIALGAILPFSAAKADLTSNLLAYYDFEETGAPGLANKAPGATSFNATRAGTLNADWATADNPTGPGFAGKADFTAATSGISDRSDLHVGKALNLDEDRDEYVRIPLGTDQLGTSFTISAWHALTPGSLNASNRYHLFESDLGFDVSWGTSNTAFATPQSAYQYLAYIGQTPAAGFGPTGVSTQVWHHVAHCISSDGTTTTLRLYVDGLLFGNRTVATNTIDFDAIFLGRQRTDAASDRDWDGMINEVALWNRALTANQVTELYQRGENALALDDDLAAVGKAFVSVDPSDPAGGETFGTGLYNLNDEVEVGMLPALGYLANGWAAPFNTQEDFFTHIATGSVTITANLVQDSSDPDNDGLSTYQELVVYGTVPTDADTDADLIPDGAEVFQSQTDPVVSQLDTVNYILTNLGGVQPGETVLTRNQANNTLTLKLKPGASTTLGPVWGSLTPASPGVAAAASSGDFLLQVPGTADAKRFFRVEGVTP
ncbi:LamG domain-containing protein [Luteolibacter sp. Populi]|uniref:LamG domain-containing protein n=1 Tax=Luteolibacter sp. Populi TaxID=3230487 RepID=UPI00346597FC